MEMRAEDIERWHLALLGAAVAMALLTRWVSPASVLLGGAVMGVNFWLMRQVSQRVLARARRGHPAIVVGLILAKFTLFLGLLGLLFWRVPIDGAGFGIGATMLLVACVAAALRGQPAAL